MNENEKRATVAVRVIGGAETEREEGENPQKKTICLDLVRNFGNSTESRRELSSKSSLKS